MTGINESDITTCNPLHEQTCHHEMGFPVFGRNTGLDCGTDASILALDSVEIRAELMKMADEENAGNRSEEILGLQILDTVDESQPSNKTSYPKRFCPCCSRPEASLRNTLNQSAIALGVCVERALSTILHRLDWTFLSVHICCVCYRKASAALKLARAIYSDVTIFFPPPKGRKQSASYIDWAFKTSTPLIAKTLVSFYRSILGSCYLKFNIDHSTIRLMY